MRGGEAAPHTPNPLPQNPLQRGSCKQCANRYKIGKGLVKN